MLAEQFARAKKIVEGQRQEVECVAGTLVAKGSLSAEEVRVLVEQQPRLKLVDEPAKKGR
ncbi:hypothetical protein NKH16_26385 [Mesorhizobium sp. M1307]|uniref:hypothetical protein n=1 Tax=Mesorhizobium sp. M1307 TaxID=2957079 RepID=UPI00333B7EEE